MRYAKTDLALRDGAMLTLRSAVPEDAEAMLAFLQRIAVESPYLLREPEECHLPAEQEREFLQSTADAPRGLMLLGLCDGELAGSCSFSPVGPFQRVGHRCEVSVALYQKFWGKGIGTAMMTAALKAAKAAGYEQAELTVVAGNKAAVALYEKLGFARCGTLPRQMKYTDGSYADMFWMMKPL